ncbi:Metallo-dependent hydrolase [Suillus clintonianus]|uniref:Metallo-dependent hydrolase n=1 Tax=Suillus clintonianus TaxID=1904413 RepID=UPI001B882139|nr:Metallo-dependent hydrolase [Suillus clintonianus]KAG2157483.1 Metallo-dependent hydrolase [Suillus clintonianus]
MQCGIEGTPLGLDGLLLPASVASESYYNSSLLDPPHSPTPQGKSFIKPSNSWKPPYPNSSPMSSSILAAYLQRREELIASDRALRIDHSRTKYTPTELKADGVVRSIRAKEAVDVWGGKHEGVPHPYPGMEFLNAKDIILKTELFKIVSKMPKGGLLHVHQNASVEARVLLDLALGHPAIHIRTSKSGPLNASSLETVLPDIRPIPVELYPSADAIGITDASYTNGWVPIKRARELFDPALGGPTGFDKWVLSAFMINPSDAFETYNTPTKIWMKFASTFHVTDPIIRFVPIQKEYLRMSIRSSIDDGISYMELRTNFYTNYILAEDAKTKLDLRELLLIFREVSDEIKAEMKAKGREDEFAGLKIIYNTLRMVSPDQLAVALDQCSQLKQEFPDLIAGFDLVGHEDGAECKPLIDYAEQLLNFAEQHPDIPFIFHAGETLGDGNAADMNLYDAILLGTRRIGHGFSLAKHPKLMEICREKKIAIEVCPISNEVLRLTSSMLMHPLPIIMNQGIPVVLSSDDPAMFNSMGLSFDFFQVLVASELTGLLALGEMARDSITYSMLDEESKKAAMDAWQRRWTKFIEEVAKIEVAKMFP